MKGITGQARKTVKKVARARVHCAGSRIPPQAFTHQFKGHGQVLLHRTGRDIQIARGLRMAQALDGLGLRESTVELIKGGNAIDFLGGLD